MHFFILKYTMNKIMGIWIIFFKLYTSLYVGEDFHLLRKPTYKNIEFYTIPPLSKNVLEGSPEIKRKKQKLVLDQIFRLSDEYNKFCW